MNEYYETLGLAAGASEAEVKRAYFKLVRKYSPESDPEMFQKIRHAYEQLKDGGAQKAQGPEFPPVSDPMAQFMLKQILRESQARDYKRCRNTCQEAWDQFPEEIQFLYYLVVMQRRCGNTGKAVSNAKKLVDADSKNVWYWKELAYANLERGFTKKAYPAFGMAYSLGCRETDFILLYTNDCLECGELDHARRLLMEMVRGKRSWGREEIPDLFEALTRIVLLLNRCEDEAQCIESIELVAETLKTYRIYVGENAEAMLMSLVSFMWKPDMAWKLKPNILNVFAVVEDCCSGAEQKKLVKDMQEEFTLSLLEYDNRIVHSLKLGCEAFCYMEDEDRDVEKYAQLDSKLCMIEERAQVLEQIEIIRQEYPAYYEKIKDFVERLGNEKGIVHLKAGLKKDFERLSKYFDDCSNYYELYPNEKPGSSHVVIADGTENTPFVRNGKKIGRNDPCPCGSGKKYKQCCMRK